MKTPDGLVVTGPAAVDSVVPVVAERASKPARPSGKTPVEAVMRIPITCPDCGGSTFQFTLIDGERIVVHCVRCTRERHITIAPVKLAVD